MTPLHSLPLPLPARCLHALRPAYHRDVCPPLFYAPLRDLAESSPLAQHPHFDEVGPGTDG
jgi:hypothetical protein